MSVAAFLTTGASSDAYAVGASIEAPSDNLQMLTAPDGAERAEQQAALLRQIIETSYVHPERKR